MTNKERYLDILSHIAWEYCKEIKLNNSVSEEQKQYIKGYMAAARSESSESFLNKEFMEILTFIREGISLKKK